MFDGNGNWVSDFSAISDRDNNIKILASRFDEIFIADLKESFENCLTKDGQTIPVGNFNMGSQKITNLNKGTSSSDAVNKEQLDALWYVGDIKTSTRDSNHGVWFLCNGQEISRTTYPELFELLGTKFGVGDNSTTFNLPDYRGKFLRGLGGNSASDIYTTQSEGLPNITGSFGVDNTHATNSGAFTYGTPRRRSLSASSDNGYTEYFDASNSNNIYGASEHVTPINMAVNYFIKVA